MLPNCPCGFNSPFVECCGKYITDGHPAPTARALMRSRYTAFTLANVDYILRTYHPKTRPMNQRQKILAWTKSLQWTGLEILSTENGLENDETGMVEFKANFIENGKPSMIHEKSLFKKEKGCWVYVSGTHY